MQLRSGNVTGTKRSVSAAAPAPQQVNKPAQSLADQIIANITSANGLIERMHKKDIMVAKVKTCLGIIDMARDYKTHADAKLNTAIYLWDYLLTDDECTNIIKRNSKFRNVIYAKCKELESTIVDNTKFKSPPTPELVVVFLHKSDLLKKKLESLM